MSSRIGFGFDTHALDTGLPFRLGGVDILFEKGPRGHSDADVLIHAIIDALFGALAWGDIGTHFPDTDPQYRGIDSAELLQQTMIKVREEGYEIVNIDTTVCLEKPMLRPYIAEMRQRLAEIMGILPHCVSVKAKTSEKMGFIGRGEGVSAYAVVLLEGSLF